MAGNLSFDQGVTYAAIAKKFFEHLREMLQQAIHNTRNYVDLNQCFVRICVPNLLDKLNPEDRLRTALEAARWSLHSGVETKYEPEANVWGILTEGRNSTGLIRGERFPQYQSMFGTGSIFRTIRVAANLPSPSNSICIDILVVDVGAFTTDIAHVPFNTDYYVGEVQLNVVQESHKLGVDELDNMVLEKLPTGWQTLRNGKSLMDWETNKIGLYLHEEAALLDDADKIQRNTPEHQVLCEAIQGFGGRVAEAIRTFCRNHGIGKIGRYILTGGGLAIPKVRAFVAAVIKKDYPDAKDWHLDVKDFLRGGSAVGGCSVFFDLPVSASVDQPPGTKDYGGRMPAPVPPAPTLLPPEPPAARAIVPASDVEKPNAGAQPMGSTQPSNLGHGEAGEGEVRPPMPAAKPVRGEGEGTAKPDIHTRIAGAADSESLTDGDAPFLHADDLGGDQAKGPQPTPVMPAGEQRVDEAEDGIVLQPVVSSAPPTLVPSAGSPTAPWQEGVREQSHDWDISSSGDQELIGAAEAELQNLPEPENNGGDIPVEPALPMPMSSKEPNWKVPVIHPLYLPYSPAKFGICHFKLGREQATTGQWRAKVKPYLHSAQRYQRFIEANRDRHGIPIRKAKLACQIEKDEKFWLPGAFLRCFYEGDRKANLLALLALCNHAKPPEELGGTWENCIGEADDIRLYFEFTLPSPPQYLAELSDNRFLFSRQVVPYVRYAAHDRGTRRVRNDLEGMTRVDALLWNPKTRFFVLFEAKVLSDISGHVTYDATRNQIARNIDVLLHAPNYHRNFAHGCFILLTPAMFEENLASRLYGFLMPQYWNPGTGVDALRRDIPSRRNETALLEKAIRRIDWLTWEIINDQLHVCPWLNREEFNYGP
jgi:hypothetical protein